jgi:hypothetical protein
MNVRFEGNADMAIALPKQTNRDRKGSAAIAMVE